MKNLNTKNAKNHSWFKSGFTGFLFLPFRLVISGFVWVYRYFAKAPLLVMLVMIFLVILCLGLSGLASYKFIKNRRDTGSNLQIEFTTAILDADEEKLVSVLQRMYERRPNDVVTKSRLDAAKSGSSLANDSDMCLILARVHARNHRTSEAAREARKRLEREPKDWFCNCVIARECILKNEVNEAKIILQNVIDPLSASPNVPDLGMILQAIELRQSIGLDCDELRSFVVTKILPNIRNQNLDKVKPEVKNVFIQMYTHTVLGGSDAALDSTITYWAFISRMSDQSYEEAATEKNETTLRNNGNLQLSLQHCVSRFLKKNKVDAELAKTMLNEIDVRGEKIWRAVIQCKPNDPMAYAGVAGYLTKKEKFDEAEQVAMEGITNAGPYPEILKLLIILDEKKGLSERSLNLALIVAKKNPDNIHVWRVLIDAARAARKRDIAIEACQKMREIRPDLTFPIMAEGILWLEAGERQKAFNLLSKLDEKTRTSEPLIAFAYCKSIAMNGDTKDAFEFTKKVFEVASLQNQPLLALSVLQALSESSLTTENLFEFVSYCDKLLVKWPDHKEITSQTQWLHADGLYKTAQLADSKWETTQLERALRAYELLSFEYPNDNLGFARLAQLKLEGYNKPEDALKSVNQLSQRENLTIETRVIMAKVYVVNKKYDEAIKLLEPITASTQATGIAITHLARAYAEKGDTPKARGLLYRANQFKMTDRERDDYRFVGKMIADQ